MKIYLDNIPLLYPSKEALKPTFVLRRTTETGDRAYSFTGDLQFTGADYDYLYAKLVTDSNALDNKVVLKFIDDCCSQNKVYEFYISHESLEWCEGSCDLTSAAVEKSIANDQYTCLQNTLIWDNFNGFKNKLHPRMSYCNELRPGWFHEILLILGVATWTQITVFAPMLVVLASTIYIINIVINALNSVLGPGSQINPIDFDNDSSTNAFTEFENYVTDLFNNFWGCGRKHPSPLVRDYIENVCLKCGLSFQSSILNDPNSPYYNVVYFNAPVQKGVSETDTTTFWIDENQPILSGLQLLEELKPVWNANFDITNSVLRFERRDFFIPKNPWLDLTTYDSSKITKVCWKWSQKQRYSYANLRYQKDGVNWVGAEAMDRFSDIVAWNNPYSSLQKGEYKPFLNYSACRFRNDGLDIDILSKYEWLPSIGGIFSTYNRSIIMNSDTCYIPMLLIWDGQYNYNATVEKYNNAGVPSSQAYNYPMWFDATLPGNLYDFHAIENPKISGYQGFDFTAEVEYDCALLSAIDIDGSVKTSRGDSKGPLTVTINYLNNTLIIKGSV